MSFLGLAAADVPLVGSALSAGSSLLGGVLGASGQSSTNAQQLSGSMALQHDAQNNAWNVINEEQDYNSREAQKNRDFQEAAVQEAQNWSYDMSSTAYQRAMDDMKKAGLNPILAANLGGASTPSSGGVSGSAASIGGGTIGATGLGSLGNPGSLLGQGVSSAGQLVRTLAELRLASAQTDKDSATAKTTEKQGNVHDANVELTKEQTKNVGAQGDKIRQDTDTSAAAATANRAAASASAAAAGLDTARTAMTLHSAREAAANADKAEFSRDRDRLVGAPAGSTPGRALQDIGQFTGAIMNAINNAFSNSQKWQPNSAKTVNQYPVPSGSGYVPGNIPSH